LPALPLLFFPALDLPDFFFPPTSEWLLSAAEAPGARGLPLALIAGETATGPPVSVTGNGAPTPFTAGEPVPAIGTIVEVGLATIGLKSNTG
jgi:hypothetical protein